MNRRMFGILAFLLPSCLGISGGITEIHVSGVPIFLGIGGQDVIQEFERRNPHIRVILGQSATRDHTGDPQRIMCSIAGGVPPDLLWFNRYAVNEWATRGAFLELTPFLLRDATSEDPYRIDPFDYYPRQWREAQYFDIRKGRSPGPGEPEYAYKNVYGIPIDTDSRALYYNKDLLIEAGYVDESGDARPPRDWNELKEMAVALSRFERSGDGKIERLLRTGFIPLFGNSWLYLYAWQAEGEFISEDGFRCTLDHPGIVRALTYIRDLYDALGGVQQVHAFQGSFQGGDLDPFITEQVAMRIDIDLFLNILAIYGRDLNFGVVPAPLPDGEGDPVSWAGGWAWVIPRGARHPEAAWEFIKFSVSVEGALIYFRAEREAALAQGRILIPQYRVNRKATDAVFQELIEDEPRLGPRFKEACRTFKELLPQCRTMPLCPVGQILWSEHVRATEQAVYHRATPEEALSRGAMAVQAELDRIYQPQSYPVLDLRVIVGIYAALVVFTIFGIVLWYRASGLGTSIVAGEHRAGVLFALPWLIGFVVFTGGPILFSFIISLCRYDVLNPALFVGWKNYVQLFTEDATFRKSLANTAYMLLAIPLGMSVSLSLAMLLNCRVRGMALYRTLYYLPAIMPVVAGAILWRWIFNPHHGMLNGILETIGLPRKMWLLDPSLSKPSIILMQLWGAGGGMIIWLAGLKGIPGHLYEAARIDGAGAFGRFRHVTLPMLSPYIFFNLIMGTIGTFQIFTEAYIMTEGGPVDSTLFYAYGLFNNAFRYFRMGYASAMAWVLFAIIFLLTLVQMKLARRWVHYDGE